jgi:hypothetical protein
MIAPQEAVSKAKKYLLDLVQGEPIEDLRLEEVELLESKILCHITLGYLRPRKLTRKDDSSIIGSRAYIGRFFEQEKEGSALENRTYKRLAIDAESGDFIGMTIREVQ